MWLQKKQLYFHPAFKGLFQWVNIAEDSSCPVKHISGFRSYVRAAAQANPHKSQ